MKYIFKNLYHFIIEDTIFFILMVLCIMTSAIVINFVYGAYQNYNILLQDSAQERNSIDMYFSENDNAEVVTKGELDLCYEEFQDRLADMPNNLMIIVSTGLIDEEIYEFRFSMDSHTFKRAEVYVQNLKNQDMLRGAWWSDNEEQEGALVAVACDAELPGAQPPLLERITQPDGTLLIGGKNYQVIGYQSWTEDGAMIPYNSVDENVVFTYVSLSFDENVTQDTYDDVKEIFVKHLGDRVTFDEMEPIDKDAYITYKSVIFIVILLAVIAAFNFVILYKYIMEKRRRTMAVLRLSGLTKWKGNLLYVGECIIITTVFYGLAVLTYTMAVVPNLMRYLPYIKYAYSARIYLINFLIYFIGSLLVCGSYIVGKSDGLVDQLKV